MYEHYLNEIHNYCRRKNLSTQTEKSYLFSIKRFFRFVGDNHQEFTCQDVRDFLDADLFRGKSPRSVNTVSVHIRCLYENVLNIVWDYGLLPIMRFDKKLPVVLSRNEIDLLIDSTKNLKHKAMIAVTYSGGLRVGETCRLRYEDISRKTMQIHIRKTKGRSDRYTILSEKCLDILTEYWFKCGRPTGILFPSNLTHDCLTVNSFECAFIKIRNQVGLSDKATLHSLRSSFATHLLEDGVSIKDIQILLGHTSMQVTEVYLKVANKHLMGIKSPYDWNRGDSDAK